MWRDAAPTRPACGSRGRGAYPGGGAGALRAVVEEPAHNAAVGVDAAIPQKRPAAADLFDAREIHLGDEDRFPVRRRLREDRAERIGDERGAPELDPIAVPARRRLVADAVHRRHVAPVRDGVSALNGAPGVELFRAVRGSLLRMPADGSGIEQDVRTL